MPSYQRYLLVGLPGIVALCLLYRYSSSSPTSPAQQSQIVGQTSELEPNAYEEVQAKPKMKVGTVAALVAPEKEQPLALHMSLLVTLPQSGANFTTQALQNLTGTSKFYRKKGRRSQPPRLPLFADRPGGPFWNPGRSRFADFDHGHILVESHCGSYCMFCNPEKYLVAATDVFLSGCMTGGSQQHSYDMMWLVRKVVHIVRNPFDNVVAMVQKRMDRMEAFEMKEDGFEPTIDGFRDFCARFNARYDQQERTHKSWDLFNSVLHVPCRGEFVRYLQWHNLAFEVGSVLAASTLLLHFEDLVSHPDATLDRVLKFLDLQRDPTSASPVQVNPLMLQPYHNYFTQAEALAVKHLAEKQASRETWKQLEQYFSEDALSLHGHGGAEAGALPAQDQDELKVSMFMSFPNSGTSFTTQLIRSATGYQTASNYATESHGHPVPVFKQLPGGPYWTAGREGLQHLSHGYLLTKTHCGGYCMSCPPSEYVFATGDAFLESCLTTISLSRKSPRFHYPAALVRKVVHIYRDPFDNIVARFHLDYNQAAKRHETLLYPSNSTGFRSYCADLNAKYERQEVASQSWSEKVRSISKGVPCRADFYRYVQWHNYAVETVEKHHWPSLILHYENYISKLDSTLDSLLTFLELQRDASRTPVHFKPGHTYRSYYTEKEVIALKEMFKLMASPGVWTQVSHYFP